MKINRTNVLVVLVLTIFGCSKSGSSTEKHQNNRNNIVNVKDSLKEIKTNLIFGRAVLDHIGDYLIINELWMPPENAIHILNDESFQCVAKAGTIGQGPGEISRIGDISIDYTDRLLYVEDAGKQCFWKYPLDSVFNDTLYKPSEKLSYDFKLAMSNFVFINDSIAIGKANHEVNYYTLVMFMAKWNLKTNCVTKFGYEHPQLVGTKQNASQICISLQDSIYVNCYRKCDLISICDLQGNLKCNIYGPDGLDHINDKDQTSYFGDAKIYESHFLVAYNGEKSLVHGSHDEIRSSHPTKFLVFDLEGNYIETLETGHEIVSFCVDEEQNRVICYFEDLENPLAYFNLNLK